MAPEKGLSTFYGLIAIMDKRSISPTLQAMAAAMVLLAGQALAAGTPAGTVIDNVAEVSFDLAGTQITLQSNIASITVVERIDVVVALQSGQVLAAAGDVDRALLFTVTNTGNGTEQFSLAIDSLLAGDDFDPVPAVPPIFFDTDASGDFTAGDVAYAPGSNDPVLPADASVDILLVNDIPGVALNGQLGRSELTASSATGTGNPGDPFPGQGDGGVDAILGTSGGTAAQFGEYLVSDVQMNIVKSIAISDPFGNQDPIPGATLTYTVTIEVVNGGTATTAAFRDAVPAGTSYAAGTITLNTISLTDATDADAGELDTSVTPTVVVRLGDLTQTDGVQTVEFQVTID
jgi:uncharacterized repeat protein (TIGR01451 family)